MGFWESATDQAGRNFGDRFWLWFAGARAVRRIAPWLGIALIAAAVVWAYRWVSPDWPAIWSATTGVVGDVVKWALVAVIVAAVVAGIGLALRALWRANSWRWSRF